MKKAILILALVVLIAGGSFYTYSRNSKQGAEDNGVQQPSSGQTADNADSTSTTSTQAPQTTTTIKPAATTTTKPKVVQGTYSDGSDAEGMGADILVKEVSFDGARFTPSSVDIRVGDIVIFRNNSKSSFWPASSPHPQHSDYPEFDAGKAVPAGGKFQFQFTQPGSWEYHDHLSPGATGTVNVAK